MTEATMPASSRRRVEPSAPAAPPDRFVTGITVGGLFGLSKAVIRFGRNRNFIIGPNGSGKTTIVHILASCLRNDFGQLLELPFHDAEILLTSIETNTETKINVVKEFDPRTGRQFIRVEITGDFQHKENIEFRSAQIDEPQLPGWVPVDELETRRLASTTAGLSDVVSRLTNTTWLSIHRGEVIQPNRPGRQSLVDRHLDNISRRFAQFNSRRNSLIDIENTEFQKRMFLSFLTPRISLATLRRLGGLNVNERIQQLREILQQLGVRADESQANLQRYHEDLSRAVSASQRPRQGRMGFQEEATLLSVNQANDVIVFWSEYRERIALINEGVRELLDVLKEYFEKKAPLLSDRGDILFGQTINDRTQRRLRPHQLSSGEKQIYIFMMEALLQRDVISIFIADEPELSLHVGWQERLVNSILSLSPNAQLIFATHSPDIVGSDQDSIIDMETVVEHA
jgi:ABC-type lipoprotein export system ATPase subunit